MTCHTGDTWTGYECEKAFDGCYRGSNQAEWCVKDLGQIASITLTFPDPVSVIEALIWFRCANSIQTDTFRIEYSDGSSEQVLYKLHSKHRRYYSYESTITITIS